ncbi:MAG: efflux RND transporter periplasmic adaptor subunit [Pseudomonadota bacterium]
MGSTIITLGFLGASASAVSVGSSILAERASSVAKPEAVALPMVSARTIEPRKSHIVTRHFQGQVEPQQTAELAFQQPGEIDRLLVDEGDRVTEGQIIGYLDTRILTAERQRLMASRKAFEAQAELARLTAERQQTLKDRGFAPQQTLDDATFQLATLEARIAETDAAITRVDVQLSHTQIAAPFDGVVAARRVDTGVVVASGQTILDVMKNGSATFRVGIDPSLADDVSTAEAITITINGQAYSAFFAGFRPDLDRQTRTRTALFEFETDDPVYLDAGTIALQRHVNADGYLIPRTALQDGVRGLWTVLTLEPSAADDSFTVVKAAVEVLHFEGETAFVRGTLDGEVTIVDAGPHRLVPGDRVRISHQAQIAEAR